MRQPSLWENEVQKVIFLYRILCGSQLRCARRNAGRHHLKQLIQTPDLGSGGYEGDPTEEGVDWSFLFGGAGIAAVGSPFFSTAAPMKIRLHSCSPMRARPLQTITDLSVGDIYDITFGDAIRTNYPATEFTVSLDGNEIGDFTPGPCSSLHRNTTDSIVATSTS